MNNKDKYISEYFDKIKDDISFITLKTGALIKYDDNEYKTDKELPVPVRTQKLLEDIKDQSENEGIKIHNIIDGIIYIYGLDPNFEYISDYKEMLAKLKFDLRPYIMTCINKFNENHKDDCAVYGKALINIEENERTCFIYASVLENKGTELNEKNNMEGSGCFFEEANKYYEKSLDYNDKFSLAYYKLGYYYKLKQKYVRAEAFWTKHQEISDDLVRTEEVRNELIQLKPYVDYENGYNLILKEKPKDGLELLLPLVKEFGDWWNLLFFIGLGYRQMGEFEIAETYFENVLKIKGDQKESLNELGLCKMCRNKFVEAAELFTKLLNIAPGNCEVFCNRAVAYLYNDEIDKAKEDIGTALKIDPNDEVALSIEKEINKKSYD